MLTGNFIEIQTDKESQKKIAQLYNSWMNEVGFSSKVPTTDDFKTWIDLRDYCITYPDITREFILDMIKDLGEVGFFIQVLFHVYPGVVKVERGSYLRLENIVKVWEMVLNSNQELTGPIVSSETAKLAKMAGYDCYCKRWYENGELLYHSEPTYWNQSPEETTYAAPTRSELQSWLYKNDIKIAIYSSQRYVSAKKAYKVVISSSKNVTSIEPVEGEAAAEEAGIKCGLERLIKRAL